MSGEGLPHQRSKPKPSSPRAAKQPTVAVEVLGNIASMESAIELAGQARDITLADLLEIRQILMERSPTPKLGVSSARNRTG